MIRVCTDCGKSVMTDHWNSQFDGPYHCGCVVITCEELIKRFTDPRLGQNLRDTTAEEDGD